MEFSEAKAEADSNDIIEFLCYCQPITGMFDFLWLYAVQLSVFAYQQKCFPRLFLSLIFVF